MNMRTRLVRAAALAAVALAAIAFLASGGSRARVPVIQRAAAFNGGPQFGDPLPGLNPAEFELFQMGLDDFLEVEDAEEGLGPSFNGRSCAECHSIPAVGGSGTILEIRAGRRDDDGSYRELAGGPVFQLFSVAPHGCQKIIPEEANVFSRRKSLPIFGDGLLEAIPDEALLARAEANTSHPDQIGGRPHMVLDAFTNTVRVGRFGWKAQQATLMTFGAEAYRDEMGITNDLFGLEAPSGFDDERKDRDCDARPDPEDAREPVTRMRGIDNFPNFMRMLAPPPRGEQNGLTSAGERIFEEIGCASCHVAELTTGPARQQFFDRKPVRAFTDLLLHDIGTGDDVPQGEASGGEFRTTPLWGVRFRAPFLHDGRAPTMEAAILAHRNQAERSRERFEALGSGERRALFAFLASL